MSNYKRVSVDNFGKELTKIIMDYEEDIYDDVVEVTKDLGKRALNMVKARSPKDTGTYASGWVKNTRSSRKDRYYCIRIRNETSYRLTHLLNFGHRWKSYGKFWKKKRHPGDNHITNTELEFKRKYGVELKHKIER